MKKTTIGDARRCMARDGVALKGLDLPGLMSWSSFDMSPLEGYDTIAPLYSLYRPFRAKRNDQENMASLRMKLINENSTFGGFARPALKGRDIPERVVVRDVLALKGHNSITMGQTLVKNYIHIVFSTKHRQPFIFPSIEDELYRYLGGICNNLDCTPIKIGGHYDHVHVLCFLSKKIALMKLVEELKSHSSSWMKTKDI